MPHLEPTYLRYIYDGLVKGSIHPENAAELPDGLIGLYEEAFDERTSVVDRQKLLQRFAIWALLKKEVSAAFVADLLGEPEEEILNFISTYSSWFNSPESGKYQLYHERLKVYLLQKLSEKEIHELHEKLILRLEQAIEEQKADEFEWYGLEFLTQHYAVNAMLTGDGSKLLDLAYNQNHWQRQLKISKGYNWTKAGLNAAMSWASKYNDDEVIECGLQLVDLHHQEQNDSPQIIALVADGDFETALKRIEDFGGDEKEGLQRKFILYMLCLMELTLLESKDKPYRKEGIEKLLKHLDKHIPVDHSLLNWNDFFPSYLMFEMACGWKELGLDYRTVCKHSDNWDREWMKEKGLDTNMEFEVLIACANEISDLSNKNSVLKETAVALIRQGMVDAAYDCSLAMSSIYWKNLTLYELSYELAKQGKKDKALDYARLISDKGERETTLKKISAELAEKGNIVGALLCISEITDENSKSNALVEISTELAQRGKFEKALECINNINSDYWKTSAMLNVSSELAKKGLAREAFSLIKEALQCAHKISDESYKNYTLKKIPGILTKQGKLQEAIECARSISTVIDKISCLKEISSELVQQRKIDESEIVMQEAIDWVSSINNDKEKIGSIKELSTALAQQGRVNDALICATGISDVVEKIMTLKELSSELYQLGKINESGTVIHYAIDCVNGINSDSQMSIMLHDISIELAKQGKTEEALKCLRNISYRHEMMGALSDICRILSKQGKFEEAFNFFREINGRANLRVLKSISIELVKQGKTKELIDLLGESLEYAHSVNSDRKKSRFLRNLSITLVKKGKINEALLSARSITEGGIMTHTLTLLSDELAKNKKVINALMFARSISDLFNRSYALKLIAVELRKQGNLDKSSVVLKESLQCARLIIQEREKISALAALSTEFALNGNLLDAENVMQEALEFKKELFEGSTDISRELTKQGKTAKALNYARGIGFDLNKIRSLNAISNELAKQGKVDKAKSVNQEALEYTLEIKDVKRKIVSFKEISVELTRQGRIEEALKCVRQINDTRFNSNTQNSRLISLFNARGSDALGIISITLAQQGKVEEALNNARDIMDEYWRSKALTAISTELSKEGNWEYAEKICQEIPQILERHSCWKKVAAVKTVHEGWKKALSDHLKFQNEEAVLFYLKGWAENVEPSDCTKSLILKSRHHFLNDPITLESLYQKYALNQLFFEEITEEKIQRFNRTLNIQWAMDIKNQLPN